LVYSSTLYKLNILHCEKWWNILTYQVYMTTFLEGRQKATEITKLLTVPSFRIRGFSLSRPTYTFYCLIRPHVNPQRMFGVQLYWNH